MDGFGFINFWGFSPALDFQEILSESGKARNINDINEFENEPINALILGAGDGRHLLKTMAQTNRHRKKKVNLYVVESCMETIARQILFLKLISEPTSRLGIQEKTEIYLELLGNIAVRPNTWKYVKIIAQELIKMITNLDLLKEKLPFLDLSNLQFKERDALESIFQSWKVEKKIVIDSCWDNRLRRHLQLRYDSREGAFDWDYNMKLADRNVGIINSSEYKTWRRSGLAFDFRDADYTIPNKTVLSGIVVSQEGERQTRIGFWGDVVVGPFLGFGIKCEDESFFKKENRMYTKKSKDISFRNVMGFFYELITEKKFESVDKVQSDALSTKENIALDISKFVSVVILPRKSANDLYKKTSFASFFHLVFCSNSMSQFFTPNLSKTFKLNALVIMETARFLLDLKNEQIKKFEEQLDIKAKECKCKKCKHDENDALAYYSFQN